MAGSRRFGSRSALFSASFTWFFTAWKLWRLRGHQKACRLQYTAIYSPNQQHHRPGYIVRYFLIGALASGWRLSIHHSRYSRDASTSSLPDKSCWRLVRRPAAPLPAASLWSPRAMAAFDFSFGTATSLPQMLMMPVWLPPAPPPTVLSDVFRFPSADVVLAPPTAATAPSYDWLKNITMGSSCYASRGTKRGCADGDNAVGGQRRRLPQSPPCRPAAPRVWVVIAF